MKRSLIDGHMYLGFSHRRYPLRIHSVERLVAIMDEYGVEQGIVSSLKANQYSCVEGNAELEQDWARYPERFIPLCTVNPRFGEETKREITKYIVEKGWKGVKLHPVNHQYAADCLATKRLLDKLGELGVVVAIHCTAEELAHPRKVSALAHDFPNIKIIMVHMGALWAWWDTIEAAMENPNLYINTADAMFCDGQIEYAVKQIGPERIMWGSNLPVSYIAPNIARITCANISVSDQEQILSETSRKLFL
jgi:predicted TIM-barrel fold metal-dependent hydrolase